MKAQDIKILKREHLKNNKHYKLMRRVLFLISLIIITLTSLSFTEIKKEEKGEVIWIGKCDYFIVETSKFYILIENYYGKDIRIGDKLVGDLHSYNFKELYNVRKDDLQKLYIENYWSGKDSCFEWLKNHNKCGFESE